LNLDKASCYKLTLVEKVGRPANRQPQQTPFLRRAGLYVAIAFELPGTILGGLLVGYLLDNYFASSPWFLITMALIAFVTAIFRLLRWVKLFGPRHHDGNSIEKDRTAH
jgi:F0F1-type ATP synthase assembly protein I